MNRLADAIEALVGQMTTMNTRVERLTREVGDLRGEMARRFDKVDAALVDQRGDLILEENRRLGVEGRAVRQDIRLDEIEAVLTELRGI